MRSLMLAAAATSAFLLPVAAHADLLGDTVHVTYNYPDASTTLYDLGYYTVPTTGAVNTNAIFSISANQITLTSTLNQPFLPSAFNGLEFTIVGSDPGITGVTLDGASTFTEAGISFTSNMVDINLGTGAGTFATVGQQAIFDLSFAPSAPGTPPSSVTPEPSSITLLGAGLLGTLGVVRRRLTRA